MPDNKNRSSKKMPEPSKPKGSLIKKLLIVFVILLLAGVGFALGIYLKLIDLQGITGNWKLHEYPVIGQYFTPPKTNFEPVELDDTSSVPAVMPQPQPMQQPAPPPTSSLNPADIDKDKLAKAKQQEEAKKISKLARLYENMKPDEAVPILNKMDDDTVIAILNKMDEGQVAKIMALFDPDRAARLSQTMMKVKTPTVP